VTKSEIEGHVDFARAFADVIGYLHGLAQEDINRVGDAVESLAEMFYTHRVKHDVEDAAGVKEAKEGQNPYPDMDSNAESSIAALKAIRTWATYDDERGLVSDDVINLIDRTLEEDVRNSRTTDGRISTTEDIQRGWAENEKKRIYEDG
jgi:hypothetical protein